MLGTFPFAEIVIWMFQGFLSKDCRTFDRMAEFWHVSVFEGWRECKLG